MLLLIIGAFFLGQYVPTGLLAVSPGPLKNLGAVIRLDGYPPKPNSFFMVSIVAKEANLYTVLGALFDPNVELWSKKAVFGSKSPEEYVRDNQKMMDESKQRALFLALKKEGIVTSQSDPFPMAVDINTGEVAGPSAGLAFFLEILLRVDGRLELKDKVAATGMLDDSGNVLAIGGIAQKTVACREKGIKIFLTPKGNVSAAKALAKNMKVVGVSNVDEAVQVLLALGALEIQAP